MLLLSSEPWARRTPSRGSYEGAAEHSAWIDEFYADEVTLLVNHRTNQEVCVLESVIRRHTRMISADLTLK